MNTEPLVSLIDESTVTVVDPAGRQVAVLDDVRATVLADRFARPLRDIYRLALVRSIWPRRYLRNREILTAPEQVKLADSRVAVIGAGGLGGGVIQVLARAGIGCLTVVDGDVFDETNLNRQVLSRMDNIGQPKALEAARMVLAINPAVTVDPLQERLSAGNASQLLAGAAVVVDALDNVPDRLLLAKAARQMALPLVHGAIAGFDGRLMTVFPEDEGLERLYGEGPHSVDDPSRPEAVLGVPSPTPSLVAVLQAAEVLKILLGRGRTLRNRMLHIDLENARFEEFSF
jgi:molybdopterin/thiamine biosynthesis adenylyltransferase